MSSISPSSDMVVPSRLASVKIRGQRRFDSAGTKHPVFASTRLPRPERHRQICDKHPDHGIARRRVGKFDISRFLRGRQADSGDDFILIKRGFKHSDKKIFGRDIALAGVDGSRQAPAPPPDNKPPDHYWPPTRQWCRNCGPAGHQCRQPAIASPGLARPHLYGLRTSA